MLQNPIEPMPDARPGGSLRERLARDWAWLRDSVRARFGLLTDDDVAAVSGQYDELSRRVSRTYGYDDVRTEEEISRFVSEGGHSAVVVAAPEDAPALDHRGMGAGVGRDDQPPGPDASPTRSR
jgi:hypothetical protein